MDICVNIPELRKRNPYSLYRYSEANGERTYIHTQRYREQHTTKIGGAASENARQQTFFTKQTVKKQSIKTLFISDGKNK